MNWRLTIVELCTLALAFTLSACGYTPHKEDAAQVGDTLSTAVGIESGAGQEANPLVEPLTDMGAVGYVGLLAIKLGMNHGFRQLDYDNCRVGMRLTTTSGWGLTGNNLSIAAGASSGLAIPIGIGVAAAHWYLTRDSDLGCVERTAEPLTDAQTLILSKWRKAYTERDSEAVREILHNPELADKYAEWFKKLDNIEIEYSGMEQTERGFISDYEAAWHYSDGKTKEGSGRVEFEVIDGVLTDVG